MIATGSSYSAQNIPRSRTASGTHAGDPVNGARGYAGDRPGPRVPDRWVTLGAITQPPIHVRSRGPDRNVEGNRGGDLARGAVINPSETRTYCRYRWHADRARRGRTGVPLQDACRLHLRNRSVVPFHVEEAASRAISAVSAYPAGLARLSGAGTTVAP
jgi:hypothetical protein